MARVQYNKIQIRRGNKASLPNLKEGEPGFCLDTDQLYIGGGKGKNVQIPTKPEMDQAISTSIQQAPLQPNPVLLYTLPTTGWTASGTQYSIGISNAAIVAGAKLNIGPGDDNAMNQLVNDGVTSLYVKNSSGTATVILKDGKPSASVKVQIEIVPTKGAGAVVYGTPVQVAGGSGFVKSSTAPSNTRLMWLDTGTSLMKYHNGSAWVACTAVYA